MNISFHVGDIVKSGCDAIVNSANPSLLAGGGLSGVIHKAAGPEMEEYLKSIGPITPGKAVSSPAYYIEADHVIHTVATRCIRKDGEEFNTLCDAYTNALIEANNLGVKTIAFPAIGVGIYKWPARQSASAALWGIEAFKEKTEELKIEHIKFYFLDEPLRNSFVVERRNFLNENLVRILHTHGNADSYYLTAWVYAHWKEIFDEKDLKKGSQLLEHIYGDTIWREKLSIENHADYLYGFFHQVASWGIEFEFDIPETDIDFNDSLYTYDSFLELVTDPPNIQYDWKTVDEAMKVINANDIDVEMKSGRYQIDTHLVLFLKLFKSNRKLSGLEFINEIPSTRLRETLAERWKFDKDESK